MSGRPIFSLDVTSRVPDAECPTCGEVLDAATGDRVPVPGDVGLCWYCGEVCRYGLDMELTVCDDPEIRDDPDVVRARAAIALREVDDES